MCPHYGANNLFVSTRPRPGGYYERALFARGKPGAQPRRFAAVVRRRRQAGERLVLEPVPWLRLVL